MLAVSFIGFLLVFVGVGLYSTTRKKATTADYLVASRDVNPLLAALSAVASNNSGYMFLGIVGTAFADGYSALWLMTGWILGEWAAWHVVPEKLRRRSEEADTETVPGFLSHGLQGGHWVRLAAGLIVILFLGLYAAAQLKGGEKALSFVFQWDPERGKLIGAFGGAAIVAAYCFAGGIRASIWTDAIQSVVMITSMTFLFFAALWQLGGFSGLHQALSSQDAGLVDFAGSYPWGFLGYFVGWIGAGVGVIGQPHVMVRVMAVDSAKNVAKTRRIYLAWYWPFATLCAGVGMTARALIPDAVNATGDTELAMLVLSGELFPAAVVGMMLAGVFAATISTADSQILACSAALTQDVPRRPSRSYLAVKLATLSVVGLALLFALFGNDSVFQIVNLAWSCLAAGLGPLMIIRTQDWRINTPVALLVMATGIAGALVWKYVLEYSGGLYQAFPGMLLGGAVYVALRGTISDQSPDTPRAPS